MMKLTIDVSTKELNLIRKGLNNLKQIYDVDSEYYLDRAQWIINKYRRTLSTDDRLRAETYLAKVQENNDYSFEIIKLLEKL